MFSSDEDLESEDENSLSAELIIVQLLDSKYKCLLDKDKTPHAVKRKNEASVNLLKDFNDFFQSKGSSLTEAQLKKKITNMKSRVKDLTDRKKTGNKKIKLREWETKMYELLGGVENPVLEKVPEPMELGSTPRPGPARPPLAQITLPPPPAPPQAPRIQKPRKPSTSPSPERRTTVVEMQLQVLHQQLNTLRLQGECAQAQMEAANAQKAAAEAQLKYFEGNIEIANISTI